MTNEIISFQDIDNPKLRNNKLGENNILKNNISSLINNIKENEINNKSSLNNNSSSISEVKNKRFYQNSEKIKNLENKSSETNLNQKYFNKNNINQKNTFLNLSLNFKKKKNIISPRTKGPKSLIKRNKFFNLNNKSNYSTIRFLQKLNIGKKNMNKKGIYYIGGDFFLIRNILVIY